MHAPATDAHPLDHLNVGMTCSAYRTSKWHAAATHGPIPSRQTDELIVGFVDINSYKLIFSSFKSK
jgi:hypothetical protein